MGLLPSLSSFPLPWSQNTLDSHMVGLTGGDIIIFDDWENLYPYHNNPTIETLHNTNYICRLHMKMFLSSLCFNMIFHHVNFMINCKKYILHTLPYCLRTYNSSQENCLFKKSWLILITKMWDKYFEALLLPILK